MTEYASFDEALDDYIGTDGDALTDIRATVRRCWFYDFNGYPLRLWQGKGRLITADGNKWLGSIDGNGFDHHKTPSIQDGRDGSSATYNMTLNLIDIPGQTARQMYEAIKSEQWRTTGRTVTCYLALFQDGEGIRPGTPLAFFKELYMFAPKFSERIEGDANGPLVKKYSISIACKDGNFGRSNVPGGTYADTIQKQRALELGVPIDKGCEYVALLANRTYQLP
jgi:hypothetical protein